MARDLSGGWRWSGSGLLAAAPVPDPVEQRRRRQDELAARHTDASPRTDAGCPFRDRCSYALAKAI